jgi:uncharacterized membrane protein
MVRYLNAQECNGLSCRFFRHARRHDIPRYRSAMIGIFSGALVLAGLFTFYPGRIMYEVVFGR